MAPSGCGSRWVFSLVATSLCGGTRVMKMDEAILFSAFLGNIAGAVEGPDRGLVVGKIRKKESKTHRHTGSSCSRVALRYQPASLLPEREKEQASPSHVTPINGLMPGRTQGSESW